MSIWSRIANVFRPNRLMREIDEELQSHLDEASENGRGSAAFGSTLRIREASRDVKLLPWLDSLRADAVFGWRQLARKKITSSAAILSLAIAIGACTSAFRLIDALLLRPLPVANAGRLYAVVFQNLGPDGKETVYDSSSYPMFLSMRAAVQDQAELIGISYAERADVTYGSDQEMEKAHWQYVSGSMFRALGVRPSAGRLFEDRADAAPHPVAVLTHDYWMRRFGGDPRAVGKTLRRGDDVFEITGVAEEKFTGTETGTVTDVFVPISMKNPRTLHSANNFWLRTLVVMAPDAAPGAVSRRLEATYRVYQQERAKGFTGMSRHQLEQFFRETFLLEPAASGRSNLQRDYGRALATLGGLVALVLLIACANVANLMTVRAASRSREMALRVSIGAGRWRLVQLVLMESAWLAFLATALAAAFAWWSAPAILAMIQTDDPARLVLPADWRVLGFALALALAVTFLFGLAPALRASRVKPASALKGGEHPHSRRHVMHVLVAAQVAFCFVVHFAAILLATSFERLADQPTGFSAERIVTLESLTRRPQPAVYWDQVVEHLRTLPGVEKVALSAWPVMNGESAISYVSVNGPPTDVYADIFRVSGEWFDAMKIPLLDGRTFRPGEAYPSSAIVNQAFAKEFFGGANPVGRFFERVNSGARVRLQIVGLTRDVRLRDNRRVPIPPTVFVPFAGADSARGTFVVRTATTNPLAIANLLRQEVPRARSEFRVSNIRTQEELNHSPLLRERLLALLGLFFAAVALLLAAIGLYGVLDYSVLQQRREIGIRLAIGARASDIARKVASEMALMAASGVAAGIALGMFSSRLIERLLFEVRPTDFTMLATPLGITLFAALFATLPAIIRAVAIDPVTMLRSE
ncbi:MAG: ADOP family duplicated permease [Acidobacteriia bacterium]|nr:ADOP family duplicated permease [Terriglobia bacterium]